MKLDRVAVTERQATVFEAETDLLHHTGSADGDAWIGSVGAHAAGWLAYGPYTTDLTPGRRVAAFRLAVGSTTNGTLPDPVATIDVYDADAGQVLGSFTLLRSLSWGIRLPIR